MHKAFKNISNLIFSDKGSSPDIEHIKDAMTDAHSKEKSIYADLTQDQKNTIKTTFEKISEASPKEKENALKIADLITKDLLETKDEIILKLRELSFIALLDTNNPKRIEAANSQMPYWLIKTGKALYYEESLAKNPSKQFATKAIPDDLLQTITSLPHPEVLGWHKTENKEIVVYKFLDKTYIGPEELKEGLRKWIKQQISESKVENAQLEDTEEKEATPPVSTKEKAAEPSSDNPPTEMEDMQTNNPIIEHSQTHLKDSTEEVAVPLSQEERILAETLSLIIETVNTSSQKPCILRDAASQNDRMNTEFPAGFRIVSDFKDKAYSLEYLIDSTMQFINCWEEDHPNEENPGISSLNFLKIYNRVFELAKENVEKLLEAEFKSISPTFDHLTSNTSENQNIVFTSWMQIPENIERIKKACREEITNNSKLFDKMNEIMNKVIPEDDTINKEGFVKNPYEIYDVFVDFILKGALSNPKIKIGPSLGSSLQEINNGSESNIPQITSEDYRHPTDKTKDKPENLIVYIPGLIYENNDSPPHFTTKIKTFFFTDEEIEASKSFDVDGWINR